MASIQFKIIIASVAIFSLAGGATGVGIWSTKTLAADNAEVAHSAEVLRNHMQADMMHDALRADVLASLLATDPSAHISLDEVKADLLEHEKSFLEMIAANKRLAADSTTQTALAKVEAPLLKYIDSATAMVDLAIKDEASAMKSLPDFMTQFSSLETAMEGAGDQIGAVAEASAKSSADTQAFVDRLLQVFFGITALFSISLFWLTRKTVTQPILGLSDDMRDLAAGNTDIVCSAVGRADEIGVMGSAVEVFRQAVIENKQLEQRAETARTQAKGIGWQLGSRPTRKRQSAFALRQQVLRWD